MWWGKKRIFLGSSMPFQGRRAPSGHTLVSKFGIKLEDCGLMAISLGEDTRKSLLKNCKK